MKKQFVLNHFDYKIGDLARRITKYHKLINLSVVDYRAWFRVKPSIYVTK